MATIKSFTDISQSKKLAEILPHESADMCWVCGRLHTDGPKYQVLRVKEEVSEPENYIPAWSLSALIDILPNGTVLTKSDNGKYFIGGLLYDNLLDVCYDMILKLHEQKVL